MELEDACYGTLGLVHVASEHGDAFRGAEYVVLLEQHGAGAEVRILCVLGVQQLMSPGKCSGCARTGYCPDPRCARRQGSLY